MSYLVRHRNSKVSDTKGGTIWAIDGEGLNWTKEAAEKHVLKCEFTAHGILFEIIDDEVMKKKNETFNREGSTKERR